MVTRYSYVDELERGISDELVLSSSREISAVLITADKDFGELVFRRGLTNTGILLVRLAGLTGSSNLPSTKYADLRAFGQKRRRGFAPKRDLKVRAVDLLDLAVDDDFGQLP
jgi:predicted nuclease of predicted toxin-antitoxin system